MISSLFEVSRLSTVITAHEWLRENRALWQRIIIVVGTLGISSVLPFFVPRRLWLPALGLLPGIGVVLFLLRWRLLGLLALFGAMLTPYHGRSGLNVSMLLVALLLGLWILDIVTGRDTVPLPNSRTIMPLILFLVIACISLGAGQLPWFASASTVPLGAQLGGLSIFVLSAGAFLLTAHYVRNSHQLERITWLFLILGSVYMVGRLFPPASFLVRLFPGSATGSMFWTWLLALALGQVVLNRNLSLSRRTFLLGLVVATIYVAYFRTGGWKSGWLPPLVAMAVIFVLRWPRLGLLVALGGFVLIPDFASQVISTDQYSYSTRLEAWLIVAEIVKVNPLLGLGPANYRSYTALFPIRGYFVQFNSHNQYVDIVAQTGLLGLVCLLWFFWEVGRLGWQLRDRVSAGFAQAYVYGALGGVAGTLVAGMLGDWFLPFFYNVTLGGFRASVLAWLFLGGLVALEQMTHRSGERVAE